MALALLSRRTLFSPLPLPLPLPLSLPLPFPFPLALPLSLTFSLLLPLACLFPLPSIAIIPASILQLFVTVLLSWCHMLLLLNDLSLLLLAATATSLPFVLFWLFQFDRDIQAVDLSIVHASLRQFSILLDFVIDDCVVLDLRVLPDADGVDISEVREDLPDVSLSQIGRKVLDSDGREFDTVLRGRGGRRGGGRRCTHHL